MNLNPGFKFHVPRSLNQGLDLLPKIFAGKSFFEAGDLPASLGPRIKIGQND